MSNLPPTAFTIRIADAQDAKWSLGISGEIELCVIEAPDAMGRPGFAWFDMLTDPRRIVLLADLTPAFASWCLWHELGHARQLEVDYGNDPHAFLHDYGVVAWEAWDQAVEDEVEPEVRLRGFNLLGWEAEAHLVAWENRMTPLTGPGDPLLAGMDKPPDGARYMEWCGFTPYEVTTEGLAYRHGMRD